MDTHESGVESDTISASVFFYDHHWQLVVVH
jgi:hypothetical protein